MKLDSPFYFVFRYLSLKWLLGTRRAIKTAVYWQVLYWSQKPPESVSDTLAPLSLIQSCTLKVHLSFSSGWPEVVISVARTNSLKSIVPSPSLSKILNKCSIITEGSSCGKIWEYMATISGFRRTPSGHSSKKRLYQSLCNRLNFLD